MTAAVLAAVLAAFLVLRTPSFWARSPSTASGDQAESASASAPKVTATTGSADATAAPAGRPLDFAAGDLYQVGTGAIARSIPITGTLAAVNRTTVKSRVAGDIIEISVREGSEVKAGQLIARLDPTDFELRVREREAQLRSAEAQLTQARRTMENNRQLLERQFISQNAFDNAASAVDVASAARDAAAAQLNQARKALADTRMAAPMAGVVAERLAQVGEKVPADTRIVTLVDLSRMEIEAPVPASEIAAVRIGQSVELAIEGVEGTRPGRVARINPGTQSGTRSVPVYIALENRDARVRAGMFAQGALQLETRQQAVLIPLAAIRDAGGRQFVYLVADGKLAEREVRIGLRDESARLPGGGIGAAEVLDGLRGGEQIVGVNLGTLRVGSAVRGAAAGAASAGATSTSGTAPAPVSR